MSDTWAELQELQRGASTATATECRAIGHAHLDTAWLWPMKETRRKLQRTFASALRLMEQHPDYRFVCTSPQHWQFLQEDAPGLYQQALERVREGRIEAAGPMWIEADTQLVSGESLVRQLMVGMRDFQARFGEDHPCRVLYLPDTFGFPASLPQIMRGAGLDTFITNKMSWCERNEFPFVSFQWSGLDGSAVLAHFTPGDNYNAPLEPKDLRHGEDKLLRKDHGVVGRNSHGLKLWLQPYGYGDGGGGPNAETVLRAERAGKTDGLPRVQHATLHQFATELHTARDALSTDHKALPNWDGELYLELHRGTFSSQAWLKRANARAEELLRLCEALAVHGRDAATMAGARERLSAVWKQVLLHQFHDILPGTSIAQVYADARQAYQQIEEGLQRELNLHLQRLAASSGAEDGWLVVNPCSTPRTGWLEIGQRYRHVDAVPALGWAVVDADRDNQPAPDQAVRIEGATLSNQHLEVTVDAAGRVSRMVRRDGDVVVNERDAQDQPLPMNQLKVYEDRPRRWQAWDLDFDYPEKCQALTTDADTWQVEEDGPVRVTVCVTRNFRSSTITQRFSLTCDSQELEVATELDWQEAETMLRVEFAVDARSSQATFGIPFGAVQRPTHRNTSQEEARFEVPGRRWMDLAQPGNGLAVLDDGLFGRSALGQTLGLTLVRAATFPDPTADRGRHAFRYHLLPHGGDWRCADAPARAEAMQPWQVTSLSNIKPTFPADSTAGVVRIIVESGGAPEVSALKPAEDGTGLVIRLVEPHGGRARWRLHWSQPVGQVTTVDLLEKPVQAEGTSGAPLRHDRDDNTTLVEVGPFQILTLKVE